MTTPYRKIVSDLSNADVSEGQDSPERAHLREYYRENPEKAREVLAGLEALALTNEDDEDVVGGTHQGPIPSDAPGVTDIQSRHGTSTSGEVNHDGIPSMLWKIVGTPRGVLAAAATIVLCIGVWWVLSSGSGLAGPTPSVQIVELTPLGTESWRPFSLERKVLPANHAYRLSPVEIENNYLAVIDSSGAMLTSLQDVAGNDWVVSIHGSDGGAASMLFMTKPAGKDDASFRRTVETQLSLIPSAPSVEPGFRLAHATNGTKVERAGGASLGSPDDPLPATPHWATDLAAQLKEDGIQINGWTFPLSEE